MIDETKPDQAKMAMWAIGEVAKAEKLHVTQQSYLDEYTEDFPALSKGDIRQYHHFLDILDLACGVYAEILIVYNLEPPVFFKEFLERQIFNLRERRDYVNTIKNREYVNIANFTEGKKINE